MPDSGTSLCHTCRHEDRAHIDRLLVAGVAATEIARRYGMNRKSVMRHRAKHIAARVAKVLALDTDGPLLDQIRQLAAEAQAIMQEARESNRPAVALSAIDRALKAMDLIGRITREIPTASGGQTINVVQIEQDPRWLEAKAAILGALERHPEAKRDVMLALSRMAQPVAQLPGPER